MRSWRLLPALVSTACVAIVAGCGGGGAPSAAQATGLIAYTHQNPSGLDQIFVMRAGGGGQHALTRPAEDSLDPVWSPDGTKLAFIDHIGHLVVMRADGSGKQIISRESGINDDEIASWSPDGRQLVFDSTDVPGSNILFVVNADGTGKHRLGAFGYGPDWSPDGKHIVFSDQIGLVAEIGVDGRGVQELGGSRCTFDPVRWSPDGNQIAFVRSADCFGAGAVIEVVNADGTAPHAVTKKDGSYYGPPSWSPDGKQIVFSRSSGFGAIGNLYVADADGSHVRQLTTDGHDFDPSWRRAGG